ILGWCMILTAFIGVVLLLFWDSLFGDSQGLAGGIGALWMFLCAAVFALYNVLNRVLGNKGYSAMEIATWSAVFGALEMIVFLPGTISDVASATAGANLAALYLGLFPSAVSYYFWSKAITLAKRTSEATNYLFINPLIASVIALIMLREIPGAGTFLGGIIIVASVIVFSTRGGK
ncbi:MAG: DMT family transporter, partial [Firmicutes bacterium]|nr:DMT family transporter [Bacillota bacterium]